MTNAEKYDRAAQRSAFLYRQSLALRAESDRVMKEALDEIGIMHVVRDPGFPCWTSDSLNSYYSGAWEVANALDAAAAADKARTAAAQAD